MSNLADISDIKSSTSQLILFICELAKRSDIKMNGSQLRLFICELAESSDIKLIGFHLRLFICKLAESSEVLYSYVALNKNFWVDHLILSFLVSNWFSLFYSWLRVLKHCIGMYFWKKGYLCFSHMNPRHSSFLSCKNCLTHCRTQKLVSSCINHLYILTNVLKLRLKMNRVKQTYKELKK